MFSSMTRHRLGKVWSDERTSAHEIRGSSVKCDSLWTEGPSACLQQVRSTLLYFSYV